jgi:hypothetical protein
MKEFDIQEKKGIIIDEIRIPADISNGGVW